MSDNSDSAWVHTRPYNRRPTLAVSSCTAYWQADNILEKLLLKKDDKDETKYIKGAVLAVLVLFVTGAVVILFLAVFYNISIAAGCIAETIMCYQILAVKSLRVESMKVYTALKQEGIEQARIAVSMIVGRDTMQLDNHGVIRAAVETVAENTSDGVVAPLFYMLFWCTGRLYI